MKDLADNSGGSGTTIDDTVTANDSTWSSTKINSVLTNYDSTLRNGYAGTLKDLADAINITISNFDVPAVDPSTPRCILTVNDETVTSDYGYTLDILHNVVQASNSADYIKTGDYINLTTKNGDALKMIFNVDRYYSRNADDSGSIISTHHIDMISENLIPNASWKMRSNRNNNGAASIPNPYLAYSIAGCVKANLADYYTNNIPNILKPYIIKKQLVVPYRYKSGTNITSDNGKGLEELPELWLPFCREVGVNTSLTYESDMRTYTIFTDDNSRIKNDASGSADVWWLASAHDGYTNFYHIRDNDENSGTGDYGSTASYGVPLCFRFV